MNLRCSFRLLAVALFVLPGLRLAADISRELDQASARNFLLDMVAINASEAAAREEARNARLAYAKNSPLSAANFDRNKDGKLDDKEFTAWTGEIRKVAAKSPEAMKRFDANKDARLDDAEWAAAVEQMFGER